MVLRKAYWHHKTFFEGESYSSFFFHYSNLSLSLSLFFLPPSLFSFSLPPSLSLFFLPPFPLSLFVPLSLNFLSPYLPLSSSLPPSLPLSLPLSFSLFFLPPFPLSLTPPLSFSLSLFQSVE